MVSHLQISKKVEIKPCDLTEIKKKFEIMRSLKPKTKIKKPGRIAGFG